MEKNDKPNNLRGFCTITLEDVFCLKNIAHSINAAFKEDWERAVMDEYQKKLNYIRESETTAENRKITGILFKIKGECHYGGRLGLL